VPETSNSQDNTNKKSEVDFKRFIEISKWTIKMLFSIDKKLTIVNILMDIVKRFDSIVNTYIVAMMFDSVIKSIEGGNTNVMTLLPYMGVLLGYNLASTVVNYVYNISNQTLRLKASPSLTSAMYKKLHELGLQKLEEPEMNNIVTRAEREIGGIISYFNQITTLLGTLISFGTTLIIVFAFAPYLIPLILLGTIPGMLHDKKYRKLIWKFEYDTTEPRRKAYSTSGDLSSLTMLSEILINKAVTYLDKKFKTYTEGYIKSRTDIEKKWFGGNYKWGVLNDLTVYLGYIGIFTKAITKQITIGDVYFQTRVIQKLGGDFDFIMVLLNNLFEFSIRINDAYVLFTMESNVKHGNVKMPKLAQGPKIEFKDLVFQYPNAPKKVINNLNLTIEAGQKVAIVGANGAGKTTLMKILCGIYDTTAGAVLINGIDLKTINNDSWYENMGVLFQEYNTHPQLTVKENIIIGNPNIKFDSRRMIEAASSADALDFIQEYPDKFDQILSQKFEKGIRPSTGQW
jgi:ABC-type multidrug transport system fused ATPase/permease subunit